MMRNATDTPPILLLLLLLVAAGVSSRGGRQTAADAFTFTCRSRIRIGGGSGGSHAAAAASAARGSGRSTASTEKVTVVPNPNPIVVLSSSSSNDGSSDENDEYDEYGGPPSSDDTATMSMTIDFRMFLTQRALQSFMFLLSQTRDMYTVRWLDEFTQPVIPDVKGAELGFSDSSTIAVDPFAGEAGKGGLVKPGSRLLMYHGLDALNRTLFPTWDAYFRQLLERPSEVLEISSGNPGTPFRTFDVDIDPGRLCSRLLAVRSQIAKEWEDDLVFLANMTAGRVLSSYWENVKKKSGTNEPSSPAEGGGGGFDREALWFLEYIGREDESGDFSPSPLRKGNFDLLKLLATREGVHRVLSNPQIFAADDDLGEGATGADAEGREGNAGGASAISREFLRNFYVDRLDSHFRGYKGYGRSDDFVEELMLSPPSVTSSGATTGAQESGLVDPLRLAEAVLKEREKVAAEWRELAVQVQSEHVEIQKLQLDRMHQPQEQTSGADDLAAKEQDRFFESSAITDEEDGGDSWQ